MASDQTRVEYQVTGMSCGHCELAVRKEVEKVPGVAATEADAQTGRLVVWGNPTEESAVIAAVENAGYSATQTGSTPNPADQGASCCGGKGGSSHASG